MDNNVSNRKSIVIKGSTYMLVCGLLLLLFGTVCIIGTLNYIPKIGIGGVASIIIIMVLVFGCMGFTALYEHFRTWMTISENQITFWPEFRKSRKLSLTNVKKVVDTKIRWGSVLYGYSVDGKRLFWVDSHIKGYTQLKAFLKSEGFVIESGLFG